VARVNDLRIALAKPKNFQGAWALFAQPIGKISLVLYGEEHAAQGSVNFSGEMALRANGAGGQS
jgi:hypothetical protein